MPLRLRRDRGDGTFRVAGGPDFVTQILDIAGADNAFADLTGRRNFPVGEEEIIARDPARYAHRLVAMKDGRIAAQGSPGEVVTEEIVRAVFGVDAAVMADPLTGTPLVLPRPRPLPV